MSQLELVFSVSSPESFAKINCIYKNNSYNTWSHEVNILKKQVLIDS